MSNIEVIIESGVRNGISTEIWLRYFGDRVKVHSIDIMDHRNDVESAISRLSHYNNIEFHIGDGAEVVKQLSHFLDIDTDKNIAILFDGPKEQFAIESLKYCQKFDTVKFGAIHDMGETAKAIHLRIGKPHNRRYAESIDNMNKWERTVFNSDDQDFYNTLFQINDKLCGENEDWGLYKKKYPIGCGLSIIDLGGKA
tara:strand:+ start:504 stop:1094 length:591 start_codon:yes stop_codon:yes gene_type:complete